VSAAKNLIELSREVGKLEWKNADFQGKHCKLNVLFTPLGTRPLL